jgi:hypothetical protein
MALRPEGEPVVLTSSVAQLIAEDRTTELRRHATGARLAAT